MLNATRPDFPIYIPINMLMMNNFNVKYNCVDEEENPEVNTSILEAAKNTELDPKAVALGAYMVYRMLELASEEDEVAEAED